MTMFSIRMGVPEMEEFWNTLSAKVHNDKETKKETRLYNQIGKTLILLADNPRHPGLKSHEINALTKRYGKKVWESYLDNKTPRAGRIFWVYGPDRGDIIIIGLEPHPNDKGNAYKKITLSAMGESIE